MASPTSTELPHKIAAEPRALAFVVSPDMPDDAVHAIADLTRAVRREIGGAS